MAVSARAQKVVSNRERVADRAQKSSGRGGAERLIWGALGVVVLAVMAAGVWSMRGGAASRSSERLPILGRLPDFSLIERSGQPLTRADLAGKVWVADFIFTHCQGTCPILSTRMAKLRENLAGITPVVLSVSMTVDPTRDSPEVLREYAQRYRADPNDWLFLTGKPDDIRRLIGEGFRLSIAERSPEEAGGSGDLITHSDRFVLVDGDSRIRGYYRGAENDVVARIEDDVRKLMRNG